MVENQSAPSLNRGLSLNFLVAEKCKPCEIYRRMCEVYWEACFSWKNLYKWAKHGFSTISRNQKIFHVEETHWLSGKKKFLLKMSVNKVMLAVFWDTKGPILISLTKESPWHNGESTGLQSWSEFKVRLHYYIHFQTNALGKGIESPFSPSYGLNSITTALLHGWL